MLMKIMKVRTYLLSSLLLALMCTNAYSMEMENHETTVLGALNKITGKTSTIKAEVGKTAQFGDLSIEVYACQKSSPLDTPESAAYLTITEDKDDIFSGWMYASSPALSSMDHGVYDIWVKDCEKKLEK